VFSLLSAQKKADKYQYMEAALWAIRISMILMVVVLAAEIRGAISTSLAIVILWFSGALLALAHSVGAMITFHHGNQLAAFESTAKQTEQLLGFRFGAGLYVNYLFVIVWLADAAIRLLLPKHYPDFPNWYRYGVTGFLVFIAINGAIVFQASWTRYVGIGCLLFLGTLAWTAQSKRTHKPGTPPHPPASSPPEEEKGS
jgi:hypothetical protein